MQHIISYKYVCLYNIVYYILSKFNSVTNSVNGEATLTNEINPRTFIIQFKTRLIGFTFAQSNNLLNRTSAAHGLVVNYFGLWFPTVLYYIVFFVSCMHLFCTAKPTNVL